MASITENSSGGEGATAPAPGDSCQPAQEEEWAIGILRMVFQRSDDCPTWDLGPATMGDPEARAAIREVGRIYEDRQARNVTICRMEWGHACVTGHRLA